MSWRRLQEVYALPQSSVDDFFGHPIALIFGAEGEVQLVPNAGYYCGLRVYGDSE